MEKKNQSNTYSLKLFELFKESVAGIAKYPEIGKATDTEKIRLIIVKDYMIFNEVSIENIQILRIWDSRQNPTSLKL
ncbi:type II toxin-antitoxin system RelE/ParE family toxin [Aequorivita sublithincola]|uniref:type II toxin-antitoxin system RelE/ParE family toxin n=1 Tax=Aequorivita sublithincola TaxID=101385 RepID=UPI0002EF8279|nr:type II toxin-antitoxin system RelE/ParE family toxin [Aequorivita sublithincola]